MPESTPVFGIPYPCANEVLTKEHFRDFAIAVDDACVVLGALADAALRRPTVRITNWGTLFVAFPDGVPTTVPFDAIFFDNDGMADLASSSLVVQTAGAYLITAGSYDIDLSTPALTSTLLEIRVNGTSRYGRRFPPQVVNSEAGWNIAGVWDLDVGDQITYVVTVTGDNFSGGAHNFSARLVTRS